MTQIIVTHEMRFARDASDYIVFMDRGEIVELDDGDVMFTSPKNDRTREFLRHLVGNGGSVMGRRLLWGALFCSSWPSPQGRGEVLRWAGDSEGGVPFMFNDPKDVKRLIGFEVDIVEALARILGRRPVFVNNSWDNLIPGLERKLYDVAINGLEVTPEHEQEVAFSIPYYTTFLQIAVRRDNQDIQKLEDLRGKVAGTLKQSYSYFVLKDLGKVDIRTYIVEANAYEDLANGRLDGTLFDAPIALYSAGFNPEVKFVGPRWGRSATPWPCARRTRPFWGRSTPPWCSFGTPGSCGGSTTSGTSGTPSWPKSGTTSPPGRWPPPPTTTGRRPIGPT
jgi:ABC-type amino acid transport substrate-binding protein